LPPSHAVLQASDRKLPAPKSKARADREELPRSEHARHIF